jgi:hypothetical protein
MTVSQDLAHRAFLAAGPGGVGATPDELARVETAVRGDE